MKLLFTILTFTILSSCEVKNSENINSHQNRLEILGKDFSNSEVLSIDIVEIEHPMLGGVIETKQIPEDRKVNFLNDFDNLRRKGMYKCGAKYVIRLNMVSDTLRLKVCGSMVSNRMNDVYYELSNEKNIIEEYIDSE